MKFNHLLAGDMLHQVALQSITAGTADAFNELPTVFATYATVWASIESLSAREIPLAKSFAVTTTSKIRIRYRTDIKATHRILYGSRVFTIDGIVCPFEYQEYQI